MDIKSYNLEDYRKFRLSRSTVTSQFTDLVEFCLISEDESVKHSFHKVCVSNWPHDVCTLLDTLGESMSTSLVPLNIYHENDLITFYTSNLLFVFRVIKNDFTFIFAQKAYHVDEIIFNRASSTDIFGRKSTLEEIIRNIVMLRYSSECKELDLSSFCKDLDFINFNIHFYKIELLAYYKELMLKMGRETEFLNLSDNGLKAVPFEIINFMKGKLIALNVSNNKINSLQKVRCNSLLEKLWLEGNPVCEEYKEEPYLYVKNLVVKFPRLQWLDDTPINRSGLIFPFCRTFVVDDDLQTKELVDKFLILYFSHYDENRQLLRNFYNKDCILSISTGFTTEQELRLPHYQTYGRNLLNPARGKKAHYGLEAVRDVIEILPKTTHDPNSFAVDVVKSDSLNIVLVVDGVYKEHAIGNDTERLVQFRRTFVLLPHYENNSSKAFYITNDLLSITYPSEELAASCFQTPVRNLNSLVLVNPGSHEIEAITAAFVHQTQLKTEIAMERLKEQNWDIKKALIKFCTQLRLNKIPRNNFIENPPINNDYRK